MESTDKQIRRLLLLGFGGLLLLLAFSGVNGLSVVERMQMQNERIRKDYFDRDRMLEDLRSELYLSGTYVRDFILEQDPNRADLHRREFQESRSRIDRTVAAYAAVLRPEERSPFQQFRTELDAYFNTLKPVLQWDPSQRRVLGYAFMQQSLLPKRMLVVRMTDQISAVNQQQMRVGDRESAASFAQFRRWLVILLILTLLCGIALAAGSIKRILLLEQILAKRFEEVERARELQSDLSARLIAVQESERRSLSRELHDEVGQSVSALLIGIGNVAAVISPDKDAGARAQLQDLRQLAEKVVAVVRDMSLLLRPSMLDDLGLIPALEWQAREVSRNSNLYVQVSADAVPEDLPDEYKTCIYRVVQEALRNAVRHAEAKTVSVTLSQKAENLVLRIQDNGRGFSPEHERGLGLLGMEERVTHLHGDFQVESRPGEGTAIYVELPVAHASAILTL